MKIPVFISSMLLACSLLVLLLPLTATTAALAQHIVSFKSADVMMMFAAMISIIGVLVFSRWITVKTDNFSDFRFVAILASIVFVLKLVWIGFHLEYPQLADHAIFLDFVTRLSRAGFSASELTQLSSSYDYYIWVSRGFPFLHILAAWIPGHHVIAAMVLNAGFQSVTLLLTDRIGSRLIPDRRSRRIGLILLACIPFHWWQTLEYGHHIFSTFCICGSIFIAIKLAEAKSFSSTFIWSAILGVVFGVLALQVGVDQLGFGLAIIAAGVTLLSRANPHAGCRGLLRGMMRLFTGMLVAVVVWQTVKTTYFDWQASFDRHHLSSGVAGFMARGWSLEQWGEYDGRIEQIDRITPPGENRETMLAMVASRIYHQPVIAFAALLPVKVAKYSLVGFATVAEDALGTMGRPAELSWFRWLRLFYAPLFLLLALCAVLHLASSDISDQRLMLPSIFLLAACGVFTLMGETSPRYSIYVQPFMALLAGSGFRLLLVPGNSKSFVYGARKLTPCLPVILILYLLGCLALWGLTQSLPAQYINVKIQAEDSTNALRFEPFAVRVTPESHAESDDMIEGEAVFYAWRDFANTGGVFTVTMNNDELLRLPIQEMPAAQRYHVRLNQPGKLLFRVTGGDMERVGYIRSTLYH